MNKGWYIVRTHSEHEKKVKESLEKKVEIMNLREKIFKLIVPSESIVELHQNKRVIKQKPFFTGYLFIEMIVDQDTYWIVRNTPGVSDFLGGIHPTPLPEEEVKNLMEIVNQPEKAKPKPAITFEKEESVRIIDGPFKHFVGVVEDISQEKAKLKVLVTVFGRPTPVELGFFQVEKI